MTNIAILFENYGPYHLARVEAFQRAYGAHEWKVVAIELARNQRKYLWETVLGNCTVSISSLVENQPLEEVPSVKLIARLFSKLNVESPDVVVIAGYSHPAMIGALCWSILNRKLTILMSASKENDAPRSFTSECIKRVLMKAFNAGLVGGKPQKRYLIKLGKPPESIFEGYNVVGNDALHPDRLAALVSPLPRPYFLTINRFIAKKNLPLLLSAYALYRKEAGDAAFDLVLAGAGELRSNLEKEVSELALEKFVHFPGFLQQSDLLPYFAHAACFIHASTQEQWGLVVNEAMAAGLPIIVSNRCGCYEDLVVEGINGFGFDPTDQHQLASLMLKMSSDDIDTKQMGKAALEHIGHFSPDHFAKGLKKAVEYVLQ